MPSPNARIIDADLREEIDSLVKEARAVARELAKRTRYSAARVFDYALLSVVVDVHLERALVYLKDCKTPERARGRLLLRAAERSFREAGDKNGPKYES